MKTLIILLNITIIILLACSCNKQETEPSNNDTTIVDSSMNPNKNLPG